MEFSCDVAKSRKHPQEVHFFGATSANQKLLLNGYFHPYSKYIVITLLILLNINKVFLSKTLPIISYVF